MKAARAFSFSHEDPCADFFAYYPQIPSVAQRLELGELDQCLNSLTECCAELGVAVEGVMNDFALVGAMVPDCQERDWTEATLDEVVEHVLETHHAFMRAELGRLGILIRGVFDGLSRPSHRLDAFYAEYTHFSKRWQDHMDLEEGHLFPYCLKVENCRSRTDLDDLDEVMEIVGVTTHDHQDILRHTERLMRNFDIAMEDIDDNQRGHRDAIAALLANIHADIGRHTEVEDDILIPALLFTQEMIRADSERLRAQTDTGRSKTQN